MNTWYVPINFSGLHNLARPVVTKHYLYVLQVEQKDASVPDPGFGEFFAPFHISAEHKMPAGWRKLPARLVEQFGDLFGSNLIRDADDYLFPSDHFGLCATVTLSVT